ncbi:MAG: hypothetical protein IPK83_22060 [Planctomycetes bacterium]|nr:hypothetical protein [Planctomycetota bacterium]
MNEQRKSDRTTRIFQAAVVVLLGLIAAALWDNRPSLLPQAVAQIPDTAMQRKQLVDEQKATNELLARILRHLETKPIKVQTVGTDETKGDSAAPKDGRSPFAGRPAR